MCNSEQWKGNQLRFNDLVQLKLFTEKLFLFSLHSIPGFNAQLCLVQGLLTDCLFLPDDIHLKQIVANCRLVVLEGAFRNHRVKMEFSRENPC